LKKEAGKREKISKRVLDIKKKYGKNAILRGLNSEEGAAIRKKNEQIGGHKA
jgi:DNA polymerase V